MSVSQGFGKNILAALFQWLTLWLGILCDITLPHWLLSLPSSRVLPWNGRCLVYHLKSWEIIIRIKVEIRLSDDIGWVILKWGWRGGAVLRWARVCSHIKNTKARDFSDPWAEGRGSEMGSLVGPERNYRWHWEKTTEIFQHLILHRWVNNASGLQP